jgi:hypothetical protein
MVGKTESIGFPISGPCKADVDLFLAIPIATASRPKGFKVESNNFQIQFCMSESSHNDGGWKATIPSPSSNSCVVSINDATTQNNN